MQKRKNLELSISDEFIELAHDHCREFTTVISCHLYGKDNHLDDLSLPFKKLGKEIKVRSSPGYHNETTAYFEEDFWRNKYHLKIDTDITVYPEETSFVYGLAYQIYIDKEMRFLGAHLLDLVKYVEIGNSFTIAFPENSLFVMSNGEPFLGEATEGFIEWFS